jgi:hypothetical protein
MQTMPRPNNSLLVAGLAMIAVTLSATAAVLAAPVAQAAGSARPHLLSCTGRPLVRPHGNVVLACGDANIEIQNTHWSSWTASSASATTTLDINLCDPTCAQSKMRAFPRSSLRLSAVRKSSLGPVFSRATITYTNAGQNATVTAYPRT